MRHRRLPAVAVLVLAVALGALYLRTWGKPSSADGQSIADLEKEISRGNATAATWSSYAQRLMDADRFADAATAWKKVLELEPANRTANSGCAIALAKAKSEEEFFTFMSELTGSDPKLAMDIFDRGECQAWLIQSRFANLRNDARAQAMD